MQTAQHAVAVVGMLLKQQQRQSLWLLKHQLPKSQPKKSNHIL
jgi:hypothetical protein